MSRIQPLHTAPLAQQICEAICAAAANGQFLPDERLVEADLAQELGVSRVPVREALRLLESQGLVVSAPYKGTRMMSVSTQDCRERFLAYRALTMEALRCIAALPLDVSRWQGLRAEVAAARAAGADGRHDALVRATGRFFDYFFDLAGNKAMLHLVQIMHVQFAVYVSLFSSAENLAEFPTFLDQTIDAIAAGQFARAEDALNHYLSPDQVGDVETALAAAWQRREEQGSGFRLQAHWPKRVRTGDHAPA